MLRIKICGITNPADADAASALGADALGFNFHDESPRAISVNDVKPIVEKLSPFVMSFGIFVKQSQAEVRAIAEEVKLRAVQTYTNEPPAEDYFPLAYMPAFRVRAASDLERIRTFIQQASLQKHKPVAVLIDSYVEGAMGGSGHVAPWELLRGFDAGVPIILAGGLTPENVAIAVQIVRPMGVDVASGVESEPRKKDHGKIRAFIENARRADVEARKASGS